MGSHIENMVPSIFLSVIFLYFGRGVYASACGRAGRSIQTSEEKDCKFPFIYMNTTYTSCTWRMSDRTNGLPWCSVAVDSNQVHINKADGSTWVNCDSECPIPSLVCMTPSRRCMEEGIMQVCDEMIQDVHVARRCVYQYNGKASHRQCTQSCQDDSSVKSMLKDYSEGHHFCEGSGTECFVYMFSCLVLFVCLIFFIIVIGVMFCRSRNKNDYNINIKRRSINPGDRAFSTD